MHVRCPHCHIPIELVENRPLADITCPSCGSGFNLIQEASTATITSTGETRRIAHFELVRELGTGQFGAVWLAKDTELQRSVAVKIPRRESLSAREAELFLRDARAAAQLQHPNIASIHEVGREGQTLYIVSDFVDGASLKEWLSARRLSASEAAQLIVKVARAVQHAHERGIVHRDLKPGNIMIDRSGEPKVIDFGLAKREAGEITMTVEGQILGTPAYMPPEQAGGKGHQADARSDVYSLGVILFELLTNELPFRGDAQMLLVQIMQDEPPRPRKLNNKIPHDLETITLKCLEKEPQKRYATAALLAEDLERWLDGETIRARPLGRMGRNWRWVKRHPAPAALGVALAASLVAGSAISAVFAVRAIHQATRAENALEEANRQRDLARKHLNQARSAVDELLTSVSTDPLLLRKEPGTQELRRKLLEKAKEQYEKFLSDAPEDSTLAPAVAMAHFRLANVLAEIAPGPAAIASYQQAIDMYEKIARENPTDAHYTARLAMLHNNIGILLNAGGKPNDAVSSYQRGLALSEKLVRDRPANTEFASGLARLHNNMGLAMNDVGKLSEALASYEKALPIYEKLADQNPAITDYARELVGLHNNVGLVLSDSGKLTEALQSYRRGLEVSARILHEHPDGTAHLDTASMLHNNIGNLLLNTGKPEEALNSYEQALAISEKLASENPTVTRYASSLARLHNNSGLVLIDMGKLPEARNSFEKALLIREKLARENPTVNEHATGMLQLYSNMGLVSHGLGESAEALGYYQKASHLIEERSREHSKTVANVHVVAEVHNGIVDLQSAPLAAESKWDEALRLQLAQDSRGDAYALTRRIALALVAEDGSSASKTIEGMESVAASETRQDALLGMYIAAAHGPISSMQAGRLATAAESIHSQATDARLRAASLLVIGIAKYRLKEFGNARQALTQSEALVPEAQKMCLEALWPMLGCLESAGQLWLARACRELGQAEDAKSAIHRAQDTAVKLNGKGIPPSILMRHGYPPWLFECARSILQRELAAYETEKGDIKTP